METGKTLPQPINTTPFQVGEGPRVLTTEFVAKLARQNELARQKRAKSEGK